eukprot:jgi/Phyca11/525878/estExt2_fgenesh1_pm.C_PHYCAscaffold_50199
MGNCCSCFSKRERSVEDLLDGSLEDKLLGKREEEDVEVTTAEEEAWRQRREQLKDEEDMSMNSLDDEADVLQNGDREAETHVPVVWDLSDRNSVLAAHKVAENLVEEDEDEETFGSAKEESDDDQETKGHKVRGEEDTLDRLTQLSSRSLDSYASVNDSYREDTRVFRDTELDNATEVTDSFLAASSVRDVANSSFLVDDDTDVQQEQEQQRKEEQDGDQEGSNSEQRRSNSSRRRSGKKKSRSRKSK